MRNSFISILLWVGLWLLFNLFSAEAASLPSSPPPFYPPTAPGPQPVSPLQNPPFVPPQTVIPSKSQPEPAIINPRTGELYPGAIGGVTNPRTGVFLPKVEGGYFNPETGEIIPKP